MQNTKLPHGRKLLALFLAVVIALSCCPVFVFAAQNENENGSEGGLVLEKYYVPDAANPEKGNLYVESYVTGSQIIKTDGFAPADMVLVLDISDSMEKDDKYPNLKKAAVSFLEYVHTNSPGSKVGIVWFYYDTIVAPMTVMDDAGYQKLVDAINNQITLSLTHTSEGIDEAYKMLTACTDKYPKSMLIFTDGEPTETDPETGTDYSKRPAILSSQKAKDAGISVYTVGLFTDGGCLSGTSDATKEFMRVLSSEYPHTSWSRYNSSYTKGDKNTDGITYSFVTEVPGDLTGIFHDIAESVVGGADIILNEKTVAQDVISANFELNGDGSDIKMKIVPFAGFDGEGNYTWGEPVDVTSNPAYSIVYSEKGDVENNIPAKSVRAEGFNYSENWVGISKNTIDNTQTVHGYKLQLIIPIASVKDGTYLDTNTPESGIIPEGSDEPIGNFPVPKTDIATNVAIKVVNTGYAAQSTYDIAAQYDFCTGSFVQSAEDDNYMMAVTQRLAPDAVTLSANVDTSVYTVANVKVGSDIKITEQNMPNNTEVTVNGVKVDASGSAVLKVTQNMVITVVNNKTAPDTVKASFYNYAATAADATLIQTKDTVYNTVPVFDGNRTDPELTGYVLTFAGWTKDAPKAHGTAAAGEYYTNLPAITENTSFYAYYTKTAKTGTITYVNDASKGSYSGGTPAGGYQADTSVVLPTVSAGKLYRFTGWKVMSADSASSWTVGTVYQNSKIIGTGNWGDVAFEAGYEKVKSDITVHYMVQGTDGIFAQSDSVVKTYPIGTVLSMSDISALAGAKTYTNCSFQSANTQNSSTGKISSYTVTKQDANLYLFYTRGTSKVTVNYLCNGKAIKTADVVENLLIGSEYSKTIDLSAFAGYTLSGSETQKVTVLADGTASITYRFTAVDYTLTLKFVDKDGKTVKTEKTYDTYYHIGDAYTVSADEVNVEGYKRTDSTALAGTFGAGDIVLTFTYDINNYKIVAEYYYNGAKIGEKKLGEFAYKSSFRVTLTDADNLSLPVKAYDRDVQGTLQGTQMPATDIIVKVTYTLKGFTVKYVDYQNADVCAPQTVNYGTLPTAPKADAVACATGKRFTGWSIAFTAESDYDALADADRVITVRALYDDISYQVTFTVDGKSVKTASVKHGNTVGADNVPQNPTAQAGYHFSGWKLNDAIVASPAATVVTSELTFVADFSPNTDTKYTVYKHYQKLSSLRKAELTTSDFEYLNEAEDIQVKYGTTDSNATADTTAKTGFGLYSDLSTVMPVTIKGDGSTAIHLYYIRNSYTLTVNYIMQAGYEEFKPENNAYTLYYGESYDKAVPQVTGMKPDVNKVTGTMTDNTTVNVNYSAITYQITVRYWSNGVKFRDTVVQYVPFHKTYSIVSPVEKGYSADITEVSGTATADSTVDVNYTHNVYTLTVKYVFNNGDKAAENAVKSLYYNDDYAVYSPYLAGCTVDKNAIIGKFTYEENKEVTVTYTPIVYDITYHNVFDAVNANPVTYTVTDTVTLQELARTGYSFEGWYSDEGCTVKATGISKGSTGNKDFYAKWKTVSYTITYVGVDGLENTNPTSYTVESADIVLASVEKPGYTFNGWYADAGFDTAFTKIPAGSTGHKTVYAKFTINQYDVKFLTWDDNQIGEIQKVDYQQSAVVPAVPERKNATANGFKVISGTSYTQVVDPTVARAQYKYVPIHNEEPTDPDDPEKDVPDGEVIITFYHENGTTVLERKTVAKGTVATYTSNVPQKSKTAQYTYTFSGWDKELGKVYTDTEYVAGFDSTVNKYTVVFEDWNGNVLKKVENVPYGTTTVTAPHDPTRDYCTFIGWSNNDYQLVTGDVTVVARYKTVPSKTEPEPKDVPDKYYVVAFLDWDDSVIKVDVVAPGKGAVAPADPVRKYCTFNGWKGEDFSAVYKDLVEIATYKTVPSKNDPEPKDVPHRDFVVGFEDDDGTLLDVQTVSKGNDAIAPRHPTKSPDAENHYLDNGWSDDGKNIQKDMTIVAKYKAEKHFDDDDDEFCDECEWEMRKYRKVTAIAKHYLEIEFLTGTLVLDERDENNKRIRTPLNGKTVGNDKGKTANETFTVTNHEDITFRINPLGGYTFEAYEVQVDGKTVQPDENGIYTVPAGKGDVRIYVKGTIQWDNGEDLTCWERVYKWFRSIIQYICSLFRFSSASASASAGCDCEVDPAMLGSGSGSFDEVSIGS